MEEEQIQKYLNILNNYRKNTKIQGDIIHHCSNFDSYMGQWLCVECGVLRGHILGQYDINDFDRLHYQKKSIYHRKYYYEKKVDNITNLIGLNDKEKSELYERLLELNSENISIINKKYSRKRIININYLIKKILKEMGCKKYVNIKLKISPKILEIYKNWWKSYKELIL